MYKSQTWYWSCSLQPAEHIFMLIWKEVLLLSYSTPFANFSAAPAKMHPISNASICLAAPSPKFQPMKCPQTSVSSSQPPTWPTKVPVFLPALQKHHAHFLASSPYNRRLVPIPSSQLLEEGNIKERNIFLMALSADDYHPFIDAGIGLRQNKKWRKQHFDQKALFSGSNSKLFSCSCGTCRQCYHQGHI